MTESQALTAAEPESLVVYEETALLLDPSSFDQLQRIAKVLTASGMVPDTLRGSTDTQTVANTFIVTEFAMRVGLSPMSIIGQSAIIHGNLSLQGKVVGALVNTRAPIRGNLNYRYEGKFEDGSLVCIAFATIIGEQEPREARVSLEEQRTKNEMYKQAESAMQKLSYDAAAAWGRRHAPEAILGICTDSEAEIIQGRPRNVTPPEASTTDPKRIIEGAGKSEPEAVEVDPSTLAETPSLFDEPEVGAIAQWGQDGFKQMAKTTAQELVKLAGSKGVDQPAMNRFCESAFGSKATARWPAAGEEMVRAYIEEHAGELAEEDS